MQPTLRTLTTPTTPPNTAEGEALPTLSAQYTAPLKTTAAGTWAFAHKSDFTRENPIAWYGLRNVVNNMIGIVGLMATIVPVRMGLGHIARWADGKGMQKTQQFFSNPVLQNILGVGFSFATFRTSYKIGQRNYDRVFTNAENAEESSEAISNLGKNIWEDFKQIVPSEYPATMLAAIPLVGIRYAFTPRGVELPKNHWKDVAACALLAYPAFFEVTDRLNESFQKSRGYTTQDKNEHLGRSDMSVGEFFTRQLPGVAAGIVPYIGFNNLAYRKTGRQLSFNTTQLDRGARQIDGFFSGFWKERPYQLFWMFSLGRDLYFDAYDALTGTTPTLTDTQTGKKIRDSSSSAMHAPETPATQVHVLDSTRDGQLTPAMHGLTAS
jgi:hypothetical protein